VVNKRWRDGWIGGSRSSSSVVASGGGGGSGGRGGCRDGGGGGGGGGGLWTWKVMDGDDGMRDGDGKMGKTNGRQFLKSTCTAGVRGRLQHTGSSHDLVGGQYQYQCHIV